MKERGGREMIVCRICGCNCDPGELEQGVCEECRKLEENDFPKMRLIRRKNIGQRKTV